MENCDAQQIAEEIGMYKGWKQYVTVLSSLDNPEIIKKPEAIENSVAKSYTKDVGKLLNIADNRGTAREHIAPSAIPSFFETKESGGVRTLSEKNPIVGF
jgi:hypothetical protein